MLEQDFPVLHSLATTKRELKNKYRQQIRFSACEPELIRLFQRYQHNISELWKNLHDQYSPQFVAALQGRYRKEMDKYFQFGDIV